MQIKVDDLRSATEKLLSHVEETHGDTIEIDEDYYWDVSEDDRFNRHQEPEVLEVGQLSDDVEEIEGILYEGSELTSYSLVRLASVLRFIGAKRVV